MSAARPLQVAPALRRFIEDLEARRARPDALPERAARRLAVLLLLRRLAESTEVDTVATFERAMNGALDLGYRAEPLVAFIFRAIHARLAGRVRRRLLRSGVHPEADLVSDLSATAMEAIQRIIRTSRREQYSLRYNLLLSIADHRTVDWLRRSRPEPVEDLEQRDGAVASFAAWQAARHDPEGALVRRERRDLAVRLRDAIFEVTNTLSDDQRAALILVEVDGIGYEDVASRLGIKRTDVGNLVRRARLARDKGLARALRDFPELRGAGGFQDLRAHRELRLQMLGWATEIETGEWQVCRDTWSLRAA